VLSINVTAFSWLSDHLGVSLITMGSIDVTAANCCSSALNLSDYQISPETGFLPAIPPLARLPGDYFTQWEDLLSCLPELNRAQRLRAEVEKLPERDFSHLTLNSEAEWRRAYTILCFIGQSYIWGEGQDGLVDTVPSKLAIPWCRVSEHLKLNPVGCYVSTVLYNFCLRNQQAPWDFENLCTPCSFTGSKDEEGFYVSFMLMEILAAPALTAIGQVFDDIASQRDTAVQSCLRNIKRSLQNIRVELKKMADRCKPVIFYTDIRPFQAGSKGLDALPNGIIYEGVDSNPRQYRGANGGQSAIIYAIDIALGTKHHGEGEEFISEMKSYMPQEHREFLDRLAEMPPIREYCKNSASSDLILSFNAAIEELAKFRTDHVILVTRYIVNQKQHSSANPALSAKGSGGTDFMQLLKKIRNETLKFIID
jgi:indoleamine 2,3-dioxygenase